MVIDVNRVSGLCAAFQGGDEQNFAALYEAMYSPMRGFAFVRLARDAQAAEDAVQDAFIEIYRSIQSLKEPRAFPKWAMTILARICARKTRNGRELPLAREESPLFENIPYDEEEFLPGSLLEREETRRMVQEVMDGLPDVYREALTLRYLNELPVLEMAEVLAVPEGTVKSRLSHAKRIMREKLEAMRQRGVVFGGAPVFVLSAVLQDTAAAQAGAGLAGVWTAVAAETGCAAVLGAAAGTVAAGSAGAATAGAAAAIETAAGTAAAGVAAGTAAVGTAAGTAAAGAAGAAAGTAAAGTAISAKVVALVLAGTLAVGTGVGVGVHNARERAGAAIAGSQSMAEGRSPRLAIHFYCIGSIAIEELAVSGYHAAEEWLQAHLPEYVRGMAAGILEMETYGGDTPEDALREAFGEGCLWTGDTAAVPESAVKAMVGEAFGGDVAAALSWEGIFEDGYLRFRPGDARPLLSPSALEAVDREEGEDLRFALTYDADPVDLPLPAGSLRFELAADGSSPFGRVITGFTIETE